MLIQILIVAIAILVTLFQILLIKSIIDIKDVLKNQSEQIKKQELLLTQIQNVASLELRKNVSKVQVRFQDNSIKTIGINEFLSIYGKYDNDKNIFIIENVL